MEKVTIMRQRAKARKPSSKTRRLLETPIEVDMLPPYVPRAVAVDFSQLCARTFLRAERQGLLKPIRRGVQAVSYERSDLLRFLGIAP